jgi:hypothetical protein
MRVGVALLALVLGALPGAAGAGESQEEYLRRHTEVDLANDEDVQRMREADDQEDDVAVRDAYRRILQRNAANARRDREYWRERGP